MMEFGFSTSQVSPSIGSMGTPPPRLMDAIASAANDSNDSAILGYNSRIHVFDVRRGVLLDGFIEAIMNALHLGRLTLPLAPGPGGPSSGQPPCPTALSAVVNGYRGGMLEDLRRVLESGDRASLSQVISVVRPYPEDDLKSLVHAWEMLTGLPAGNDVYVLRASWDRQPFLIPQLALLSLLVRPGEPASRI